MAHPTLQRIRRDCWYLSRICPSWRPALPMLGLMQCWWNPTLLTNPGPILMSSIPMRLSVPPPLMTRRRSRCQIGADLLSFLSCSPVQLEKPHIGVHFHSDWCPLILSLDNSQFARKNDLRLHTEAQTAIRIVSVD
jgi:hypothetical protein